jgi:hypothetical protein
VEVAMDVKNVGQTPLTYWAADQRLVDNTGRQYAADLTQVIKSTSVDINAGNTAPAILMFDVPTGTQLSQYVIVLHASSYSRGVTAAVS